MFSAEFAAERLTRDINNLLSGLDHLPDSPEVQEIRTHLKQMLEITEKTLGREEGIKRITDE